MTSHAGLDDEMLNKRKYLMLKRIVCVYVFNVEVFRRGLTVCFSSSVWSGFSCSHCSFIKLWLYFHVVSVSGLYVWMRVWIFSVSTSLVAEGHDLFMGLMGTVRLFLTSLLLFHFLFIDQMRKMLEIWSVSIKADTRVLLLCVTHCVSLVLFQCCSVC